MNKFGELRRRMTQPSPQLSFKLYLSWASWAARRDAATALLEASCISLISERTND